MSANLCLYSIMSRKRTYNCFFKNLTFYPTKDKFIRFLLKYFGCKLVFCPQLLLCYCASPQGAGAHRHSRGKRFFFFFFVQFSPFKTTAMATETNQETGKLELYPFISHADYSGGVLQLKCQELDFRSACLQLGSVLVLLMKSSVLVLVVLWRFLGVEELFLTA